MLGLKLNFAGKTPKAKLGKAKDSRERSVERHRDLKGRAKGVSVHISKKDDETKEAEDWKVYDEEEDNAKTMEIEIPVNPFPLENYPYEDDEDFDGEPTEDEPEDDEEYEEPIEDEPEEEEEESGEIAEESTENEPAEKSDTNPAGEYPEEDPAEEANEETSGDEPEEPIADEPTAEIDIELPEEPAKSMNAEEAEEENPAQTEGLKEIAEPIEDEIEIAFIPDEPAPKTDIPRVGLTEELKAEDAYPAPREPQEEKTQPEEYIDLNSLCAQKKALRFGDYDDEDNYDDNYDEYSGTYIEGEAFSHEIPEDHEDDGGIDWDPKPEPPNDDYIDLNSIALVKRKKNRVRFEDEE